MQVLIINKYSGTLFIRKQIEHAYNLPFKTVGIIAILVQAYNGLSTPNIPSKWMHLFYDAPSQYNINYVVMGKQDKTKWLLGLYNSHTYCCFSGFTAEESKEFNSLSNK